MQKEMIGLNTYLYIFDLDKKDLFISKQKELSKYGAITQVYINNAYAFEIKMYKSF